MNEDTNNHLNESIEISYDTIEKEEYYTIHQVADKLGISTTKVNHYIFKLNRFSKDNPIILDSSKLTDGDIEKLEIFKELKEQDHMSPDDIAKYFKENYNNLINRETNTLTRDLTNMDITTFTTSIVSQLEKRMGRMLDIKLDEKLDKTANRLENSNKVVAQIIIDETNKGKNEIKKEIDNVKTSIGNRFNTLEQKMEEKDRELERLTTKLNANMSEDFRKESAITKLVYDLEIEKLKNKSWLNKLLGR